MLARSFAVTNSVNCNTRLSLSCCFEFFLMPMGTGFSLFTAVFGTTLLALFSVRRARVSLICFCTLFLTYFSLSGFLSEGFRSPRDDWFLNVPGLSMFTFAVRMRVRFFFLLSSSSVSAVIGFFFSSMASFFNSFLPFHLQPFYRRGLSAPRSSRSFFR